MSEQPKERWQSSITSLKQGIQHIYETKEFSDVVFKVGKKHIKAHKLVLASKCSEFARILLNQNSVEEIIVEDDSVTETGFEVLLRFIYQDILDGKDKQSIVEAFAAATYYNQRALKEKCEREMESWTISVDEVCELLNVSLSIPKLRELCLNVIKNNALDVVSSPSFLKLNYKALYTILDSDALKEVAAKTRITRIVEWGERDQTKPVNYEFVRQDFLVNKPLLLAKMGLEELSMEEFNELFNNTEEFYSGLLTDQEILRFFKYYGSRKKSDLPSW